MSRGTSTSRQSTSDCPGHSATRKPSLCDRAASESPRVAGSRSRHTVVPNGTTRARWRSVSSTRRTPDKVNFVESFCRTVRCPWVSRAAGVDGMNRTKKTPGPNERCPCGRRRSQEGIADAREWGIDGSQRPAAVVTGQGDQGDLCRITDSTIVLRREIAPGAPGLTAP